MIIKKKTLNNYDSILQNLDIKVKLKEIYEEAPFPKAVSIRRFVNIFSIYIEGAWKNYNYTANTLYKKVKDKDFFYNAIKKQQL